MRRTRKEADFSYIMEKDKISASAYNVDSMSFTHRYKKGKKIMAILIKRDLFIWFAI